MIPLSDGLQARRMPFVNWAIIVANFAVWIFYELPHLNRSVADASFYPCTVNSTCHHSLSWGLSWITSMFLHGSWDHILGNMIFLAVFGKNVEDAYGHLQYLLFYFAGGFVATMTQTAVTLWFGSTLDAHTPNLGASGAIAAVLGGYFILYPKSTVFGLITIIPAWIPAWVFLGFWFLYQLYEGGLGFMNASAHGGGVAFFAHIGGFAFGALVTLALVRSQRIEPQSMEEVRRKPAICGF